MNKFVKWTIIVLVSLFVLGFIGFKYMQHNTKKASPEQVVELQQGDLSIEVFYCRPYKKDRPIFGGLVPFNEVWRTGANEATSFTTNRDINIDGQPLAEGEYTLWTIPGKEEWKVIFNSKMYGWGVSFDGLASREAEYDVLMVSIPVTHLDETIEQFTINLLEGEPMLMQLTWDQTQINVPITAQ